MTQSRPFPYIRAHVKLLWRCLDEYFRATWRLKIMAAQCERIRARAIQAEHNQQILADLNIELMQENQTLRDGYPAGRTDSYE